MKITDEMLYRHAAEARDIWLTAFPDDSEIPEHPFSEEFNNEMDKLIAQSHKSKKTFGKFQRIAAVFAAMIVGTSSFIAVNAEARSAFVGWVKELTDDYLIYRYEEEPAAELKPLTYRVTWLPDGYTEFLVHDSENSVLVAYTNETGEMLKLHYIDNPDETDWFVDTSNAIRKSASVNGIKADLLISTDPDTSSGVAWVDQYNTAFLLSGFLDEETLLRVAESVRDVDLSEITVEETVPGEPQHYDLTMIPEGYANVLSDHADDGGSVLYENEAGQYLTFIYNNDSGESSLYIDGTASMTYQTLFNGYVVDVMVSKDPEIPNSIVWVGESDTVFYVSGFFDPDTLFEIAGSIQPIHEETTKPDPASLRYEPTLIPEGYTWHRERDFGGMRSIVYKKNDADRLLRYHYIYGETSTFTDAVGSTHSTVDINGYRADMLLFDSPETSNCIMWTDENDCVHAVHAFLDEADLIKVAESVQLVD